VGKGIIVKRSKMRVPVMDLVFVGIGTSASMVRPELIKSGFLCHCLVRGWHGFFQSHGEGSDSGGGWIRCKSNLKWPIGSGFDQTKSIKEL
jgi:hypothetical protein